MTTTDRRDATDATWPDAVLVDGDWISPSREEQLGALTKAWADAASNAGCPAAFVERMRSFVEVHERNRMAALAALKPAPGTDTSTSTEDALHRVLDLADELDQRSSALVAQAERARDRGEHTHNTFWLGRANGYSDAAAETRAAVAGPQRDHDEEGS